MYWTSGQRMLEAARLVASRPNLHIIYISNFKCGPDSYIKYFTRQAAGAPLLVLQFDGHGNDAGYLTRCEAYLDSKGILRCYSGPDRGRPAGHDGRPPADGQDGLHPADGLRQRARVRGRLPFARRRRRADAAVRRPDPRTRRALHVRRRVLPGQGDDRRFHAGARARPDADPARTVFFLPTADGPCRFGQYAAVPAAPARRARLPPVDVLSPTSRNAYGGLGSLARPFVRTALADAGRRRHPAETAAAASSLRAPLGAADATFEECLDDVCTAVEHGPTSPARQLLSASRRRSCAAACGSPGSTRGPIRPRPLIGVVGEIFCRLNTFSNEDAVRRLEQAGAEVWLSGHHGVGVVHRRRAVPKAASPRTHRVDGRRRPPGCGARVQHHDERVLLEPFTEDFRGYEEPGVQEVVEAARPYLPADGALGEMVLSVGTVDPARGTRRRRHHRHQPVHLHERDRLRGGLPARLSRSRRPADPFAVLRRHAAGPRSDLGVYLDLARSYQRRKKTARPLPAPFRRSLPGQRPLPNR